MAALLLTQRLVDVDVEPLKASEYWALFDRVPEPSSLLGLDVAGLEAAIGGGSTLAERVSRLFDAATAVAFTLDELEQSGVCVVTSVDDGYPASLRCLGAGAPPSLSVAGDAGLLSSPLLGVVGSRDVSEEGADAACAAAREAAGHGFGTVSGGAKGVDRLAMGAALDCGAVAAGVLADSLLRTVRDADIRRAITEGQLCLCSPFKPSAPFTVANAMGRNKVIYAVSAATLVVASDLEGGGTWAGATEALQRSIAPVLVWTGPGDGPGNVRLVERGATPIATIEELFPLPEREARSETEPSRQLVLDV